MLTRRTLLHAGALSPLVAPMIANAQVNPTPAGQKVKTPYDFGARGGAVIGACTLERGAVKIAGMTSKDAGKVVMIAGAVPDARSLVARVREDGTLDQGPARDVINASYHVGYDDTAALQRFLAAGGGVIPDDVFLCQRTPLKYRDNCEIRWQGTILFGESWPSGFGLMGDSYGWTGQERRMKNVFFRGEGKNATILLSPANIDRNQGRKCLGITCTDNFELSGLRLAGGISSLFALQIHYSTSGTVKDCQIYTDGLQFHQGSDGIHFVGNCSDVRVIGLRTWTADDSSSQTSELPQSRNTRIERITYENCVLENYGHSSVKGLITAQAEASVIQDIQYVNCRFVTHLAEKGNGVPVIITNEGRPRGAVIQRITISGGETIVDNQWTKQIGAPAVMLKGVDQFAMKDHSIEHCGQTVVMAEDCRGLQITNTRIAPKRILPPPASGERVPVVRLANCPDAKVDTAVIKPSYNGQPLVG